ncbi:hypothetical protein BDN72DRAFT_899861 [Pluteus cervinus]|uniref:Uncharacterized protein n=1 Tax=Pluteus cervinus TaxID=181527 RepID=A0ACD3AKU8_9AGAR|nr:hypothetical protein BDN72DRAFT_899861 [Pluteus cervinus]
MSSLEHLFTTLERFQEVNYASASALTWIVYDFLLTFDNQVLYLRKSPWGVPKVLYLIMRYNSLTTLTLQIAVDTSTNVPEHLYVSDNNYLLSVGFLTFSFSCKPWLWYNSITTALVSAIVGDALLLLRLNALYKWERLFIIIASLVWFSYSAVRFFNVTSFFTTMTILPAGHYSGSAAHQTSILVACLPVVLFAMILFRFIKSLRTMFMSQNMSIKSIFEARTIMPTMYLFFRDGAFYFLMTVLAQILYFVFLVVLANSPLKQMGTSWAVAIYCITSTRAVENLRGLSERMEEYQVSRMTLTTIQFQSQGIRSQDDVIYLESHYKF